MRQITQLTTNELADSAIEKLFEAAANSLETILSMTFSLATADTYIPKELAGMEKSELKIKVLAMIELYNDIMKILYKDCIENDGAFEEIVDQAIEKEERNKSQFLS